MSGTNKVSCVLALVIPSSQIDRLRRRFERLTRRWGYADREIKGSRLGEAEVSAVIQLLREYEVIAEVVFVDTGIVGQASVTEFQRLQADKITEQFSDSDEGRLIDQLRELRGIMMALPPQLVLQTVLTIRLVENVLETATLFYVQRRPVELSSFDWTVDAKNVTLTNFERLWSTAILPMLQTASITSPFPTLEGQDYSHFAKFYISNEDFPDFLRELSQRSGVPGDGGIDLKRVLTDCLRFADSNTDPGLRMADIVASAFTRALNGTLGREGWRRLGELMVRKPLMVMLRVNKDEPTVASVHAPYAATFHEIEAAGRPMLTPRNNRRANRIT